MRSVLCARWTALAVSLVFTAQFSQALDPFQEQQAEQKRALEDPNKLARPVTNELKGAEIKDYQDKISTARAQVFREGAPPASASLRVAVKDTAGGTMPTSFVAEGRLQDFNPSVRKQIESKLQAPPAADDRVQARVSVGKDDVTVADARLVPNLKSAVDAVSKTPGDVPIHRSAFDVPRVQPANLHVRSLREAPADAAKKTPDDRVSPAAQTPAGAPGEAALLKPASFTGLAAVAAVLVGAPMTPPAASVPSEPVALIPVPDGDPLVVVDRSPNAKTQEVAVTAPASALPAALKNQIRAEKGDAALPADATLVQVTVEIHPDRTLRVVDVKPAKAVAAPAAPAASAKTAAASQAVAPTEKAQPAAVTSVNPTAPAPVSDQPAPPAAAQSVADQPFPAVTGAKALATAIGLDPSTVQLKPPAETVEPKTLSIPTNEDRSVQMETLKADDDHKPAVVRADGRFGDFAPATQQQIREILGHFNAAPLIEENSRVVFEAKPGIDGKPALVSISIQDPKAPDQKTVVVWKEGEAVKPVEAPAPATGAPATSPGTPAEPQGPATVLPPTAPSAAPRAVGLAPSAAAIASTVYGLPDNGFELKPADPKGGIQIQPVPTGRAPVVVEPQPVEREGAHDFASVGKDVDFTDAIRAEVDAKLKAAVENGETWASDALKGNREVLVTFEVDETGPKPVVRVKDVSPTLQDAAKDAATAMGLQPGQYFIVNVGDQALIVLEQGAKGEVRMANVDKFKLLSPDGDAKVFVNPNKAPKDPTTVLMLSRESLKANRATLVRLGGPVSEAAIKACMDANPKSGQFIVRLDPNADEKLVIKAMQAGVPDPALTTVKKRSEENP